MTEHDGLGDGAILRRIQELDLEMDALQVRSDEVPKQMARWRDTIQAREIDKAMFARQREDLLLKQRKFEADIAQRQEIRGKYNQQLTLIKTNREYRALLEELEGVNAEIRGMEDIVLSAMTDIESVDLELARQDEAIRAEEVKISENRARLEAERAELERQIAVLRAQRDELATQIAAPLLHSYERIRSRRGGAVVAPLDSAHGVCGGCHMGLRPQDVNEIMGGTLVPCQNCGRLLYHDEQAAESKTA